MPLLFVSIVFSSFSEDKSVLIRVGALAVAGNLPLALSQEESVSPLSKAKVMLDLYSSPIAVEAAYRAGAVEAAAVNLSQALIMADDGIPLKVVIVLDRNGSALVIGGDSESALKGKIIGGSGDDTVQFLVFNRFLKNKKLSLGYDVRFLFIPFSRAIELLREKKIYGFCLPEPYGAYAQQEGLAKKVVFSKDIIPNHIDNVLIVRPVFIKKHSHAVKELVKSITESCRFIEKDKKASGGKQTALMQAGIFNIPHRVLEQILSSPADRVSFINPEFSPDEISKTAGSMIKLGILKNKPKLDDILDTSFIAPPR